MSKYIEDNNNEYYDDDDYSESDTISYNSDEFDEYDLMTAVNEIIYDYSSQEPFLANVSYDDVIKSYPNRYKQKNVDERILINLSKDIMSEISRHIQRFNEPQLSKLTANKIFNNIQYCISRKYI